jgi:hypothetical protein
MKKLSVALSVALIIMPSLYSSSAYKLYQAVYTNDSEQVEKILKKELLSQRKKEQLLKIAEMLVVKHQSAAKSVLKSSSDITHLIIGACVTIIGTIGIGLSIASTARAWKSESKEDGLTALVLGSAGIGMVSLASRSTVKGWNMSGAYSNLSKALAIEDLIQNASIVKNGSPS